jgi:hypothetical protein
MSWQRARPAGPKDPSHYIEGTNMLYEMRVYYCLPGRLPALNKRFSEATLKIWERFGIRQVGFFTDYIGDNNQKLTYILAWESLAERETKWNAFQADPEWQKKRAESEADGPIVAHLATSILAPTAYSQLK